MAGRVSFHQKTMTLKPRFYSQKLTLLKKKVVDLGQGWAGLATSVFCKVPSVAELVELVEGFGRHGGDGFKFWQQGAYLALYS